MANGNHLAKLVEGVAAWNEWRQLNPDAVPDLADAVLEHYLLADIDLSNAILLRCRFVRCDLTNAIFTDARLREATFLGCHCRGADFVEAKAPTIRFSGTDLTEANFLLANLSGATLDGAELANSNLSHTNLSQGSLAHANLKNTKCEETQFNGADLEAADFTNADVFRADLTDANLWATTGLEMDNCRIVNARIWPYSNDKWSVLRRRYTGPRLAINLLFVVLFFLPLVLKGSALWGISELERLGLPHGVETAALPQAGNLRLMIDCQHAGEAKIALQSPSGQTQSQKQVSCRTLSVWKMLLGVGGPYWYFMPVLTIILMCYQCTLFWMTYQISLLRDAEERSGYSPVTSIERDGSAFGHFIPNFLAFVTPYINRLNSFFREPFYTELYRIHRLLLFGYWISIFALGLRAYEFLSANILLLS
jgi:uncharacterized protein YjbI with pentapeptide repeats